MQISTLVNRFTLVYMCHKKKFKLVLKSEKDKVKKYNNWITSIYIKIN